MATQESSSTAFIDTTTAAPYIDEKWSQHSLVARESALIWAELVDRRYESDLNSGDTIHVNSVSNLAASNKIANTAVTYENYTEDQTDISIDQHGYHAIACETIVDYQSYMAQLELYAPKQGYALGLQVDDSVAGLPDDLDNSVGTLAVELTDDNLLRARQYLNDANAPMENRAIGISPAQEAGFLKLDRFVNSDYSMIHGDSASDARDRAFVGTWMRMPIYVSTNIEGANATGHDNCMWQEQAFALVMQTMPKTYRQFDIDYLTTKVVVEQLYGFREMRDDHAVWMKGA